VRQAKEQGLSLTGPDGLLEQLTKAVLETVLNEEMTEHLGYERHDPAGAGSGNIRNGTRGKTVLTEASGQVEIDVPRDRVGRFEPQIVRKRQRRLNGVDEIVVSLYAKGLMTGEISAHFAEIYGASVSKETISRITDKVIEEMQDWAVRPTSTHVTTPAGPVTFRRASTTAPPVAEPACLPSSAPPRPGSSSPHTVAVITAPSPLSTAQRVSAGNTVRSTVPTGSIIDELAELL
jgi:hypothetical protein